MAVRGGSPLTEQNGDETAPPLPSRTPTGLGEKSSAALIDENDEGAMNGLSGWEVLKPG
jgi:hypothetical protein